MNPNPLPRGAAASLALCAALAAPAVAAQVGLARPDVGGQPVTLVYPTLQPAQRLVQGSFLIEVAPDAAPTPGRHRLVVMSHGTGGSALSDHALAELPGAGHFDLLAPWPADVAQRVGAAQARGGFPEPGFDPALRQAAFERIAACFDRTLRP